MGCAPKKIRHAPQSIIAHVRHRTFDHEADIGIAGEGATLGEAFAGAATAMYGVIAEGIVARDEVRIECEAPDLELLLVSWLNALLAETSCSPSSTSTSTACGRGVARAASPSTRRVTRGASR